MNVPSEPAEYVQVTVVPDAAQLDGSVPARACSAPDSAAKGSSRTNPVASNRQPEWEIGPPKGPAPTRRLVFTLHPPVFTLSGQAAGIAPSLIGFA